jgi:hypothetical protein
MSARYPDPDPAEPWAAPVTRPPSPGLSGAENDHGDGWGPTGSSRPDWGMASYPPFAGRPPIVTVRDLWAALSVIVLSAALGIAAGFVWIAAAPKLQLEVRGDAAIPVRPEGEALIGIDGTFALIAIGGGVLCAIAAYLWLRRGIGVVCALVAGGALAAWLAAYVGGWAGPAALATHRGDPDGTVFTQPLDLRATGVILLWPIAALLVYLLLMLVFDHEERPRGDGGWSDRPW